MKNKKLQIPFLLLFFFIFPILTGCLTEIPFDVTSNTYNLTLSEKDTFKEISIKLPDESQYDSAVISNGVLEYSIENLSDNASNVDIYIGSDTDINGSGLKLLSKGIASQETESGTVTNEELIKLLKSETLYLGMKCDENAVVSITFKFKIAGSYNIVQGLSN